MSVASELTIALLKEALTGKEADLNGVSDETLAEVFILSRKHDLAHLVGERLLLRGIPLPEKLKHAFETEAAKAFYRYTRLWDSYAKAEALLEEEGIDYLPLKGAVLKHLYPRADMRSSCDVDVLLKEEDAPRAADLIVERLGFTKSGTTYHDISLFYGEGVHLELHYNISQNDSRTEALLASAWDYSRRVGDTHKHVFTPDFLAFFITAHACRHFQCGGCGIRILMDLWLLRNQPDFDDEGTRALCEKVSLLPFYEHMLALANAWFSDGEKDEVTSLMEDFILRGGIYGNRENRINAGVSQRKSRLRHLWARIFIPRRYLMFPYPILKKHPILMPVCQVRRWFRILFSRQRKGAIADIFTTANLDKGVQEVTTTLFERLGLTI